jgi:hypothetical protein
MGRLVARKAGVARRASHGIRVGLVRQMGVREKGLPMDRLRRVGGLRAGAMAAEVGGQGCSGAVEGGRVE